MGRVEKYANVIDEYEEKLKKEEEKLSITRELKFSELQKEIDNTVTIADYEEIENMNSVGSRKSVTDTSEIQVEDVSDFEDTSELDVSDEDTLEIIKTTPLKKQEIVKEETDEVKIIDEPTEELIAMDGEESDKDEDDLYLTKSINPIRKKKVRLKKIFKVIIIVLIILILSLVGYFKLIKPFFSSIVNSDPRKVFENGLDYVSDEIKKNLNQYADDRGVITLSINAKIDSNINNFSHDDSTSYNVLYGYDPMNKRLLSDISVSRGEEYRNSYLLENNIVYQSLSGYDKPIKLDTYTNVLSENNFYKNNKDSFDKLQKYISPTEYMYYINNMIAIYKNFFEDSMFAKENYKIERKGKKVSVVKNTLTLDNAQLTKINNEINKKIENDAKFKKVADVYGDFLKFDDSNKKVVINIYTKFNNKVVGYDIEEDGFTTSFYYKLKDDGTSYDAYFKFNGDKYDISRRDSKVEASINGSETVIKADIKEDKESKLILDFELTKNNKNYNGTLELDIDKSAKKYTFDYKVKNGDKYFNAVGSLSYKSNKKNLSIDLTGFVDPPISDYTKIKEEFNSSFSTDDLYKKYDSWYNLVTNPDPFSF